MVDWDGIELPEKSLFSNKEYQEIEEVMTRPECQSVVAVLGRRDEAQTTEEIVSGVRASRNEVERAIESLVSVGLVRRSKGPDGEYFRASSIGRTVLEDGVAALVDKEWEFID